MYLAIYLEDTWEMCIDLIINSSKNNLNYLTLRRLLLQTFQNDKQSDDWIYWKTAFPRFSLTISSENQEIRKLHIEKLAKIYNVKFGILDNVKFWTKQYRVWKIYLKPL